ncbi:PspC domain-containing protein [Microbacterium sp. NPDC003461]
MSMSVVRPRGDRVLVGVCGLIARRFGLSSTLVRVLAVIGVLFFGWTIPVYIALWVVVPSD